MVAYSFFISGQIANLRRLQTDLTDRNRRDSLQLLRIQNDLNQLALAMRDMLDNDSAYRLEAWRAQFDRIRDRPRRRPATRGRDCRRPDEHPNSGST